MVPTQSQSQTISQPGEPVPVLVPFRRGIQGFIPRIQTAGLLVDEPTLCEQLGGWVAKVGRREWLDDLWREVQAFNSSAPNGRQGNITIQELTERQCQIVDQVKGGDQRGRALTSDPTGRGQSRTFSELMKEGRGYHGKNPRDVSVGQDSFRNESAQRPTGRAVGYRPRGRE